MWELEKPYITSFTQLHALDRNVGVLGHPKRLYDKNLNRNLRKIRKEDYDSNYDIYGLHRKPHLYVPQKDLSLEGYFSMFLLNFNILIINVTISVPHPRVE